MKYSRTPTDHGIFNDASMKFTASFRMTVITLLVRNTPNNNSPNASNKERNKFMRQRCFSACVIKLWRSSVLTLFPSSSKLGATQKSFSHDWRQTDIIFEPTHLLSKDTMQKKLM